jgi:hypothetical protein
MTSSSLLTELIVQRDMSKEIFRSAVGGVIVAKKTDFQNDIRTSFIYFS